jgi:DNA-binding beta-propeller fold protein YncE
MTRALSVRLIQGHLAELTQGNRRRDGAGRSCRSYRRRPGHRSIAALAVAGGLALSLVTAFGAAASGSVAAAPGVAAAGPGAFAARAALASRFGALLRGPARPSGAGQAAPEPLAGAAAAAGRGRGFVVLSGSPGVPVANPRTHTVYVPIQCTNSSCATPARVVDVISTARCNVKVLSGCRVVARARAGTSPLAAAIDPRTDTVYVVNGISNTLSVLNGARCNAEVTSGCARPVATVRVGQFPVAGVVNPVTRTLYVANLFGGSLSVINVAACNARTTRGCGRPARTVPVKAGPDWVDVDLATDTVYTANSGTADPSTGDTVSVINGAACKGHTGRGCRVVATVTVGVAPFGVAVDQASDTVYTANFANEALDGSVSVIDGARCNGRITSGCRRIPPTVPTGIGAAFVAVDRALHTVFAVNAGDDTLSAIDTRTCGAVTTSGCGARPPNEQAAPVQNPGFVSGPGAFALVPGTGTAYVVGPGGPNMLSVTGIGRCNAVSTSGCRAEAPAAPENEFLMSADPATNTIYAGNITKPQIDVINGATCNATLLSGCRPIATIPVPDPQANVGAIDEATHTLYAADEASAGTVMVINTATCNAGITSGCAQHPPMVKIGAFPSPPVFNHATHTVYASYGMTGDRVAVINAATCNAVDTSGCGQVPAVVKVGAGTFVIAVSSATDTVYGPNSGAGVKGDTVSVINGATCNGTTHAGCGHLAATIKVGLVPNAVAVNDRTHTVYVTNNAFGDSPGTVSVINTATCNGTDTAGCGGPFPVAATGISPVFIVADTRTDTLYVTDFSSASVTVLDGSRCNAEVTAGCRRAGRSQAVGSAPGGMAVNPRTGVVYVANAYRAGSLSVFAASRR